MHPHSILAVQEPCYLSQGKLRDAAINLYKLPY